MFKVNWQLNFCYHAYQTVENVEYQPKNYLAIDIAWYCFACPKIVWIFLVHWKYITNGAIPCLIIAWIESRDITHYIFIVLSEKSLIEAIISTVALVYNLRFLFSIDEIFLYVTHHHLFIHPLHCFCNKMLVFMIISLSDYWISEVNLSRIWTMKMIWVP